jgi:general secretion pathway protein B
MSYILEALRRADAQRERDPARGIHAQPAAGLPPTAAPAPPRWAWIAGAAALLLAGGWLLWQQAGQPAPVASPLPPAAAVKLVAAPDAAVSVAAVPAPAAALLPPAPPPLPAPQVERIADRSASRAVLKAPPPATAQAAPAAPARADAPPAKAEAAVATAAPAQPPRILSVAELPAAVKGELPKLAITGGVWSEDPGQRMLIVGGKVVSEGAELAPGVVLEQIRSRSAVMRFKGLRYSVGF